MENKLPGKTVQQAIEITGLGERQILYRLRRGHIDAFKVGWVWIITEKGMDELNAIKNSKRKRLPNGASDVKE